MSNVNFNLDPEDFDCEDFDCEEYDEESYEGEFDCVDYDDGYDGQPDEAQEWHDFDPDC